MLESKHMIKGMVGNVIANIFPMIGDSNVNIALSACKVLQKAADYIPDSIIDHPSGKDFLGMLGEGARKTIPIVFPLFN